MQKITDIKFIHDLFLSSSGVTTDTRRINKDNLFFALQGANFNANEFASKAIKQGCIASIVDDENYANEPGIYLVDNVLITLQKLSNFHRNYFNIPVLGITGSNGKTTNKELIHSVLKTQYNTLATIGNLNNHIGVPLTLLRLTKEHEFAIIEMGANHQGEINLLCEITNPTHGYITNIGKAHLEGFGGIEGVKKGKTEMYRFLSGKHGEIFVNGDDPVLHDLAEANNKITFGTTKLYDTIGKDVTTNEMVEFKFTNRYGEKDWNKLPLVKTSIVGRYNFINCLAAACIGHYFKISDANIKKGIESYVPDNNRSQLLNTGHNQLLLDAYNANPNSMRAAIENFSKFNAENKWVILGDMFELGEYSFAEHEIIVEFLKTLDLQNVLLVGEEFSKVNNSNFKSFKSTEETKKYLIENKIINSTILIKGSRGMKMESLKEAL
jgi:UDP-N-acetylmuramoyl-tripeptide--D-alanyl-D-alanine ligase